MTIEDRMNPDDKHCGPVALARVLGISTASVMSRWPYPWKNPKSDTTWYGWPIDTPWLHRKYVEGVLGRAMVLEPQEGPFPANCVALLHNDQWGRNFVTRFLGALMFQHWVVVLEDNGTHVVVDWGTKENPTRTFERERFLKMVNSGWPYCVYSIK